VVEEVVRLGEYGCRGRVGALELEARRFAHLRRGDLDCLAGLLRLSFLQFEIDSRLDSIYQDGGIRELRHGEIMEFRHAVAQLR